MAGEMRFLGSDDVLVPLDELSQEARAHLHSWVKEAVRQLLELGYIEGQLDNDVGMSCGGGMCVASLFGGALHPRVQRWVRVRVAVSLMEQDGEPASLHCTLECMQLGHDLEEREELRLGDIRWTIFSVPDLELKLREEHSSSLGSLLDQLICNATGVERLKQVSEHLKANLVAPAGL